MPEGFHLSAQVGGRGRRFHCNVCGCADVSAVSVHCQRCSSAWADFSRMVCPNLAASHNAAKCRHRFPSHSVVALRLTPACLSALEPCTHNAGMQACWPWPSAVGPTLSSRWVAAGWGKVLGYGFRGLGLTLNPKTMFTHFCLGWDCYRSQGLLTQGTTSLYITKRETSQLPHSRAAPSAAAAAAAAAAVAAARQPGRLDVATADGADRLAAPTEPLFHNVAYFWTNGACWASAVLLHLLLWLVPCVCSHVPYNTAERVVARVLRHTLSPSPSP
jgi:hypothetical protein